MISRLTRYASVCFVALTTLALRAGGEVIEFGDGQKEEWEAAVGEFTTIPFTEFPDNTIITDQYSHLGIHFVNGGVIVEPLWEAFPEDGAGFKGPPVSPVILAFDEPMTHIAIDFPEQVEFQLFSEGSLVYTSSVFGFSGLAGQFAGLFSTNQFDEVTIHPTVGLVWIDNLHFGPPIPAPAVGVILLAGLAAPRRRRC